MEEDKSVNILLLGETGTGKSTFINAFANYLNFSSFEEAKNAPNLKCLIPAKFSIRTTKGLEQITIGEHKNENTNIGQSSTRGPHVHCIDYEDRIIQIIDTPGINDSGGKDQDNFESILLYLEQFKLLHAICFVLKPDTRVITAGFNYCLRGLLSRLHRSAAENIMFVFTRTKGTNYDAPDTLMCLTGLVNEIKESMGVEVPLRYAESDARKNCFFMDNEGFQYFVALSKRYSFEHDSSKSWEVSNKAARDIVKYILGTETRTPVPPHNIYDTLIVNKARQLIHVLSQPLKDVNEHLDHSLEELNVQRGELQQEHITAAELRQKLKITIPKLNIIELDYPITVCTSKCCTGVIRGKTHYKQRCHSPCVHLFESINQVPILSSFQLMLCCPAISFLGRCKICLCEVSSHMTIDYETQIGEEVKVDLSVQADLSTRAGRIAAKRAALSALESSLIDLEQEKTEIATAIANFASFIRANSMCPINDAYADYLDLLIKSENKGVFSDKKALQRYESMQEDHIKYKAMLEQGEAEAGGTDINSVTSEDVMKTFERLKKLPHTGEVLAKMQQNVARLREKMRHSAPKNVKTRNQLMQEIENSFIQDTNHSLALINEFIQGEERAWAPFLIKTVKNTLGTLKNYAPRFLVKKVDDATIDDSGLANMDASTLWNKIKAEKDAVAMRKIYEAYQSCRKNET